MKTISNSIKVLTVISTYLTKHGSVNFQCVFKGKFIEKFISLLIILVFYSFNNSNNNQLWLSDFELLKSAIVNGYANLQYASEKEGMDLVKLNNFTVAVMVGENSYGAGYGYTNGGQSIKLENIGLTVKIPDCVRLRKDGKNEIYGIKPDIYVPWNIKDSKYDKGLKVIQSIEKHIMSSR
ncbi:hypothetical protein [Yeosuana marina]|uniref:hypothetical protein n=1 Tax=Yeosuana marina TaxID=1565536 RepID=UPI0030EEFFDE|tara:strand:+ start:2178 stop:2717 length:540 start_codon:yes stop_codon:yes gene_type:complete